MSRCAICGDKVVHYGSPRSRQWRHVRPVGPASPLSIFADPPYYHAVRVAS